MFDIAWATRSYFVWMVAIGLLCFLLERIRPWRKEQRVLRKGIVADLFFLVFNGHYFGVLFAFLTAWVFGVLNVETLPDHVGPEVISTWPWALQFLTLLVLKDFLEWCVHVLLHRVHWLWQFHKLHHSIEELDWIGNFRFHFGEILIYRTLTFLPLLFLGAQPSVLLVVAVLTTLISDLNHTNFNLSWGPLRYVLNSPRMHVWHHDIAKHGRHGQNYGIVFSTWDWIFGTAHWPSDRDQPEKLGFKGMPRYPRGLLARLLYPFDVRRWRKPRKTTGQKS